MKAEHEFADESGTQTDRELEVLDRADAENKQDPKIRYTLFTGTTVKHGTEKCTRWSTFIHALDRLGPYANKQVCPLVKLASFGNRTLHDGGSTRNNENVLSVYGVECDHDAGSMSIDEAAKKLRHAGIKAVVVSTASHTAEVPRWRVFAPFAEPKQPTERARYVAMVNRVLDGSLAKESFTLSTAFYCGRVEGKPYQFEETEGQCLDALPAGHIEPLFPELRMVGALRSSGSASGSDFHEQLERDDALGSVTDETISELKQALEHIPSDDRHVWISVGQALASLKETPWKEDARELWIDWSAKSPSHQPDVDPDTWDTFSGKRTSYRAVFVRARECGWKNPWLGKARDVPAPAADAQVDASVGGVKLLTPREVKRLPAAEWMIPGLLPRTGLAAVIGPSSVGKTWAVSDIGFAVARGVPWQGMPVLAGPVVYVAGEGVHGYRKRLEAYEAFHRTNVDDVPFYVAPSGTNLLDAPSIDLLIEACASLPSPPRLVIIDTLNRSIPGGDENSSVDMGLAISSASRIMHATGALVVFVHHTGKDATRGARGHSSLKAAMDTELEISMTGDIRIIEVQKQRDGETGSRYGFKLESVEFVTADGETENGAAVVSVAVPGNARTERVGKFQKLVLAAWERLEADFETVEGAGVDQLVAAADEIFREKERKAPDDRFREQIVRALKALTERNHFEEVQGKFRPASTDPTHHPLPR